MLLQGLHIARTIVFPDKWALMIGPFQDDNFPPIIAQGVRYTLAIDSREVRGWLPNLGNCLDDASKGQ
jgi:hypothetical protein